MKVLRQSSLILLFIILGFISHDIRAKETKAKKNRILTLGDGEYKNEEMNKIENEQLDHTPHQASLGEDEELDNRNMPIMNMPNQPEGKEENDYLAQLMDNMNNRQINQQDR
jgi:hypothetical protein